MLDRTLSGAYSALVADILLTVRQKSRVVSILRQHALIFGAGLVDRAPGVAEETDRLLASLDALDAARAGRIASILQQHALIFGAGMVLDRQETKEEDLLLVRALRSGDGEPQTAVPPSTPDTAGAPLGLDARGRADAYEAWRPPIRELSPHAGARVRPSGTLSPEAGPRPYPLQGRARRRSIAETIGMIVVVIRSPAAPGAATIVVVPMTSVARSAVDREPAEIWIRGDVHVLLLEPWRGIPVIHTEWPSALGDLPSEDRLLRIGTESKDRICLGMRPLFVPMARRIVISEADGVSAWVFPGERHPGLVPFLARSFQSRLRIGPNDAEGTAYFAVARIVGRA